MPTTTYTITTRDGEKRTVTVDSSRRSVVSSRGAIYKTTEVEYKGKKTRLQSKYVSNYDREEAVPESSAVETKTGTATVEQKAGLQTKSEVAKTLTQPERSYTPSPTVQTLSYETPVGYNMKVKGGLDYVGIGTYKATEVVNLEKGYTTRTTSETDPLGNVIATGKVTAQIRREPDTSNLPKPPTVYDLTGGTTGRIAQQFDKKREEFKTLLSEENLSRKERNRLEMSAAGLDAAKTIVVGGAQVSRGAALLATVNSRGLKGDIQYKAYGQILSDTDVTVKVGRTAYVAGAVGLVAQGVQAGAAPQVVKAQSLSPVGTTRVTKFGNTVVTYSKATSTTQYYATPAKTGFQYVKGAGLTGKAPNTYLGSTKELLTSTTTTKPFTYTRDPNVLQTKTTVVSQTYLPSGSLSAPQVVSRTIGYETIPQKTPALLQTQGSVFVETTGKSVTKGVTSYTYTSNKGGLFQTKAVTKGGESFAKTTTKSSGTFDVTPENVLIKYQSSSLSLGKRGSFGAGGSGQLLKTETITQQIPLIVRQPSFYATTTPIVNTVGTAKAAIIAGGLTLTELEQDRLPATLTLQGVSLGVQQAQMDERLLTPIKEKVSLQDSLLTPDTSRTTIMQTVNVPAPPTTPTRTGIPPPPPPSTTLIPPPFSLSLGGGSGSTEERRGGRLKRRFGISPLVYSTLRGTAKRGQRISI